MNRKRLWRLAALLLMLVAAYGIFVRLAPELAKIRWSDLSRIRPSVGLLASSFLLLIGVQLLNAFLWRRIAVDLDSPAPNARATLHTYFISSLGRYIPGRVWQIAGLAGFAERFGMSPARAAAASVIGTVFFLATGLVYLGITLPMLQRLAANSGASGFKALAVTHPVVAGSVMLALAAIAFWSFVATSLGRAAREFVVRIVGETMGSRLRDAFALVDSVRPRHTLLWAAGYLVSWWLLGVAFATFVLSFSPQVLHQFLSLGGIVAASYLAGWIAFMLPAGVGAREGVMIWLLTQAGLPAEEALVIAVLSRVWFTAAELLPISFVPFLAPGAVSIAPLLTDRP